MQFIPAARKVLGLLADTKGSVGTAKLVREVAKGVIVTAMFWAGMPIIEIDVQAHGDMVRGKTEAGMWIPEGFVFYPASDDSPNGWGLPVNYNAVEGYEGYFNVFAPENLKPGLDVSRWTPGGCLGQVLVTQKVDAGYPKPKREGNELILYPPLYHPQYGPHPTKPQVDAEGAWKAYRLEFTDYQTNVENTSRAEQAAGKRWKREEFRLLNEHRDGLGLGLVLPPVRGDYDSAQATCEWSLSTHWFGHSCDGFPITWKAYADRGRKNGSIASEDADISDDSMRETPFANPTAEILANAATFAGDFEYTDQTGFGVFSGVAFFGVISAQATFDAWMGSPPHKAIIEEPESGTNLLRATFTQIGHRDGMAAAHFHKTHQWVESGNAFWLSEHPEVPILSWQSFTSKNLYGDTWPVRFAASSRQVGPDILDRTYIHSRNSLLDPPDGEGVGRTSWYQCLHYAPGGYSLSAGTLGSHIFARGRTIAIAPDSGYVLAAGIAKIGDAQLIYRLIALCLHKADEPGDYWDGYTPKVRVWWCDLPAHVLERFNGVPVTWFAANPHTIVREKYNPGLFDWPWKDEADWPYQWRGGDAVDVGSSGLGRPAGDLKSYASLWQFNASGTKAVCLRHSYDMERFSEQPRSQIMATWASEIIAPRNAKPRAARSYISLNDNGVDSVILNDFLHITGSPVFCEMTLTHGVNDELTTAMSYWTHNPAGGFVSRNIRDDVYGAALAAAHWYIAETPAMHVSDPDNIEDHTAAPFNWEYPMRALPIVAYYDDDGSVRAVYDIETNMRGAFVENVTVEPETSFGQTHRNVNGMGMGVFYRGIAVGASIVSDADCREMLTQATLYSSEIGHGDINTMADWPIVLHASDDHLAFVTLGVDAPLVTTTEAPENFPFNPAPFASIYEAFAIDVAPNPNWAPWDSVETSRPCIQMDVWHNGSRIHTSRHANPHKFHVHRAWSNPWNWYSRVLRWDSAGGAALYHVAQRWNTAWGLIGNFVVDRQGNWAVAATFGFQRGIAYFRNGSQDATYFYTDGNGTQYGFDIDGCTVHNTSGPYNLNGFVASSFADQSALASMMQIPGANPRSHYVRVV